MDTENHSFPRNTMVSMVWPIVHSDMGLPKFAGLNAYHCFLYRKTMKPPEERLKACRTKHVRTCSETRKLFLGIPVLHPNHLGQEENAKRRVASVQSYQSGSSSTIVCATMQLHVSNLENHGRGTAGRPIFMGYLPTIPGISSGELT